VDSVAGLSPWTEVERFPADNPDLAAGASRTRWHRVVPALPGLRAWLVGEGSLTQRLKRAARGFEVVRLAQGRGGASSDEIDCIRPTPTGGSGMQQGRRVWQRGSPRRLGVLAREVLLVCDGSPTVFAHSVIDAAALRGRWRWLAGLGSRPLGEALFRDPQVRRGPLRFRQLRAPDRRYMGAAAALSARGLPVPPSLWARRSVFSAGGRQLLVTEVFLPAVASLPSARSPQHALPRMPGREDHADEHADGR
jgi:chorismate--pyruvate lyase